MFTIQAVTPDPYKNKLTILNLRSSKTTKLTLLKCPFPFLHLLRREDVRRDHEIEPLIILPLKIDV
jgi:hypothetical protein